MKVYMVVYSIETDQCTSHVACVLDQPKPSILDGKFFTTDKALAQSKLESLQEDYPNVEYSIYEQEV